MNTFYVWAAMDRAHDYTAGDLVPDGAGAYLHAGDTLEAARAAMVSDPATYETAAGDTAPLYVALSDGDGPARIVTGPHTGSAWPMPYAPKRYRDDLASFVSLATLDGDGECVRCGGPDGYPLDGGDLIVCGGCV